jgi:hypothetical protein
VGDRKCCLVLEKPSAVPFMANKQSNVTAAVGSMVGSCWSCCVLRAVRASSGKVVQVKVIKRKRRGGWWMLSYL